jgi:hypothetical protein
MISAKTVAMKASLRIRDNLDPESNFTDNTHMQSRKQLRPDISTEAGTPISINPVSRNVSASIRDNLDRNSKVTTQSHRRRAKDRSRKTSTDAKIII